jgi:hypothetical protein
VRTEIWGPRFGICAAFRVARGKRIGQAATLRCVKAVENLGCGRRVGITEGGRSIGPARPSLRYSRFLSIIGKRGQRANPGLRPNNLDILASVMILRWALLLGPHIVRSPKTIR